MILYGLTVYLETPPAKREGRLLYMLVSLMLFILPTVAILVLFHRYFNIWWDLKGPLDYFPRRMSQLAWARDVNNTLVCMTILLGDSLMFYRCYIIWVDRLWVLIVPGLLYITVTGKRFFGSQKSIFASQIDDATASAFHHVHSGLNQTHPEPLPFRLGFLHLLLRFPHRADHRPHLGPPVPRPVAHC